MLTGSSRNKHSGFTYLTVLFIIVVMGIMLARAGLGWSQAEQREKELDLLFAGNAYRQAIMMYYERTPGLIKNYPATLEDLLTDTRYNLPQHYLRKLYRDPVMNQQQWNTIMAPEGGIMGVHSFSKEKLIKTAGFDEANISFEGAARYSDWEFVYVPRAVIPRQTQ